MPSAGFTNLGVSPGARDGLRTLTYTLTGRTGSRVSMSRALTALVKLGELHADELVDIVTDEGEDAS